MSGISVRMTAPCMKVLTVDGGHAVESGEQYWSTVGVLHPGERVDLVVDWSIAPAEAKTQAYLEVILDRESVIPSGFLDKVAVTFDHGACVNSWVILTEDPDTIRRRTLPWFQSKGFPSKSMNRSTKPGQTGGALANPSKHMT